MISDIYKACTSNIKELKSRRKHIQRAFNRALRENSQLDIELLTKIYALFYSAYAEAAFLKLINTPSGFELCEIDEIEKQRNLEEKWLKCFEFAFNHLNLNANKGEIANKRQTLQRILEEYIINPSQIRNKIAHGQWSVCLNNDCTKINLDTTNRLKNLDFVQIDILFSIYEKFQQCIEDLIESPKTHYRDYYLLINQLSSFIDETKSWSLESKRIQIQTSKKQQGYIKYRQQQ